MSRYDLVQIDFPTHEGVITTELFAIVSFKANEIYTKSGKAPSKLLAVHASARARRSRKPVLSVHRGECILTAMGLTDDELYKIALSSPDSGIIAIDLGWTYALFITHFIASCGLAAVIIPEAYFKECLSGFRYSGGRVNPFPRIMMGYNRDVDEYLKLVYAAFIDKTVSPNSFADSIKRTTNRMGLLLGMSVEVSDDASAAPNLYSISQYPMVLFTAILAALDTRDVDSITVSFRMSNGIAGIQISFYTPAKTCSILGCRIFGSSGNDIRFISINNSNLMLKCSRIRYAVGKYKITLDSDLRCSRIYAMGIKTTPHGIEVKIPDYELTRL